jgi:hypothetical protein
MDTVVSIRKNGVISVVSPVKISPEVAKQIIKAMKESSKKLREDDKPVLIEVNAKPLKYNGLQSRKAFLDSGKNLDFDYIAVIVGTSAQMQSINLILSASRYTIRNSKADMVKIFNSKSSADRWLKEVKV